MEIQRLGERFKGPIPQLDGAIMELGPDGNLIVIVQCVDPTKGELQAWFEGVKSYSLFISEKLNSLAVIFQFVPPIDFIECFFNGGLYADNRVEKFIKSEANILQMFVLDGSIIRSIRVIGLHKEFLDKMKEKVRSQSKISLKEYNKEIDQLCVIHTNDIYLKGQVYKMERS